MIYNSAVEQIKGARASESEMLLPVFRLATVTSLSSGRAYIQFYGETTASTKLYPYLEGYKPTVGDKVLVLQQGSTFIIAGKISKDNVVDNYYLIKSVADSTYLTQAAADQRYAPIGGGGGGGGSEIKNTNYGLGFSSSTSADIVPNNYNSSSGSVNLGTTSKKLGTGYFNTLGGNSSGNSIQTAHIKNLNLYDSYTGDLIPSSNNTYSIGNSTYKLKKLFVYDISLYGNFVFGSWKPSDTYSFHLDATANNSGGATFTPSGSANWGTSSNKFNDGYFTTLNTTTLKATTVGADSSSTAVQNLYVASTKVYGNIVPDSTSNNRNLGSSSAKFNTLYAQSISGISTLGGTDQTNSIQTLNVRNTTQYGDTTPDTNESRSLGTSSKRFKNIYTANINAGKIYLNTSTAYYLELYNASSTEAVYPSSNKVIDLGSSGKQFNKVYANQFYQNGTAISTSDRRRKTGIKGIGQKYIDFFRKLKPRLFRFKDGESGRLHSGFVAQEVEEAAAESGIPTKDLAFLCIDENGDYGLRYEELIAIQTQVIQDLMNRVEILEEKMKGR